MITKTDLGEFLDLITVAWADMTIEQQRAMSKAIGIVSEPVQIAVYLDEITGMQESIESGLLKQACHALKQIKGISSADAEKILEATRFDGAPLLVVRSPFDLDEIQKKFETFHLSSYFSEI